MPLRQKQEDFCVKYIECGNASEAYRLVYNSKAKQETINRNGKALLDHPAIIARLVLQL